MTPNELLDNILNWFATSPNAKPSATITEVTIAYYERSGNKNDIWFGNLKVDLIKLVHKLEKDIYIISRGIQLESNEEEYTITFEGIVFQSTGGYVKQNEKEITSKNLKNLETWTIAMGAGLAGLWVIYSFLRELNFCNCH